MTLATKLTLSRIALLPVVILLWNFELKIVALVLLGIAMMTDYFDGYVARMYKQETTLGALLDPVADKTVVLVMGPFLSSMYLLAPWYVSIVVFRNVAQLLAIPVLTWWLKIPFFVKPKPLPKIATGLCFVILWLAMGQTNEMFLVLPLLVSAGLELWILAMYLPRFYQIIQRKHDTFE